MYLPIAGFLVNSDLYYSYLCDENIKISHLGKLIIWYLVTFFGALAVFI